MTGPYLNVSGVLMPLAHMFSPNRAIVDMGSDTARGVYSLVDRSGDTWELSATPASADERPALKALVDASPDTTTLTKDP